MVRGVVYRLVMVHLMVLCLLLFFLKLSKEWHRNAEWLWAVVVTVNNLPSNCIPPQWVVTPFIMCVLYDFHCF